ncbi:hypothetical protein B0T25DRAFT_529608 [Lasiosphaeria hispida]|uniref:Uncharacterized protein n=1 Tax=Lasiosphaeria hispida TaxID=260671 RepID=A0AAJ0HWZ6_9PEZI|nr:hypothetical protein B0T25DRAFT_529608 [Lasiosphaeria hispida]
MVKKHRVVSSAATQVALIENLLQPIGRDGGSLWSHEALAIPNRILRKVKALRHACRDGDGFTQRLASHQQCSRWLLDTLQDVVDSDTWMDTLNTDLERHLRLALEGIHAIRELVPMIDMLVGTIAEGAEEIAVARAVHQGAPREWSSGSDYWKRKRSPEFKASRDRGYGELLRAINTPRALQHLDSVALEPYERAFNRTHLQVRDQAMLGWKRLRNQLKAMLAHPIPNVTFVRHASSGTGPPEVVVVGPLPPEDGVWVDGNVVRYLPTIPQAVEMLTLTNQEITALSSRNDYEIGLAQSRTLKDAIHPHSSFYFDD